jgi:hypothetical protein
MGRSGNQGLSPYGVTVAKEFYKNFENEVTCLCGLPRFVLLGKCNKTLVLTIIVIRLFKVKLSIKNEVIFHTELVPNYNWNKKWGKTRGDPISSVR